MQAASGEPGRHAALFRGKPRHCCRRVVLQLMRRPQRATLAAVTVTGEAQTGSFAQYRTDLAGGPAQAAQSRTRQGDPFAGSERSPGDLARQFETGQAVRQRRDILWIRFSRKSRRFRFGCLDAAGYEADVLSSRLPAAAKA